MPDWPMIQIARGAIGGAIASPFRAGVALSAHVGLARRIVFVSLMHGCALEARRAGGMRGALLSQRNPNVPNLHGNWKRLPFHVPSG